MRAQEEGSARLWLRGMHLAAGARKPLSTGLNLQGSFHVRQAVQKRQDRLTRCWSVLSGRESIYRPRVEEGNG